MAVSKPGIVSLLIGLLVIIASWYFWFQSTGIWQMLILTIQGGIVIFGLFMVLIGFLMLII